VIARLDAFIAAHPEHPQYTPDALLRLGSLHLDAADDAIAAGDEPAQAAHTGAAVSALAALVARFPSYPRLDDAQYLLGHAHEQAGDLAVALAAYEAVAANAASPRALESRFRAGELYLGEHALDRAIAAYRAVVDAGLPPLSTIARYQLAWSYRRADDPVAAIRELEQLVELADAGGDATALDLRADALQYLALWRAEVAARARP
jgi:tetratricopeptide (TPR) repeat protein